MIVQVGDSLEQLLQQAFDLRLTERVRHPVEQSAEVMVAILQHEKNGVDLGSSGDLVEGKTEPSVSTWRGGPRRRGRGVYLLELHNVRMMQLLQDTELAKRRDGHAIAFLLHADLFQRHHLSGAPVTGPAHLR